MCMCGRGEDDEGECLLDGFFRCMYISEVVYVVVGGVSRENLCCHALCSEGDRHEGCCRHCRRAT